MKESDQSTPWYFGFEEYKKVTGPQKKQKSFAWTTAIGLQAVEGLTPSDYLLQTARRNIEGEISIQEANYIIDEYYKSTKSREEEQQHRTEEAEKTFKAIKENPQGTIKVLALNLGVSEKTVKNHIAKLKKAGLITRAGSDTKGHWIINGEN